MLKTCPFALFILFSISLEAQKQPTDSIQQLDEIILKANTILGSKFVAKNRTGASYYLSSQELRLVFNSSWMKSL